VYGEKAAEIVLGNCDTWLYLRTADIDTARAISAKAGTYTVRTLSVQRRPGLSGAGTEGATSRALLTPDEVLRWPSGQGLLLQAGQFPARLPMVDLSSWRQANGAFRVKEPLSESPRVADVPTWVPGGCFTGTGPVYREKSGEAVADKYAKHIFGKR
ncbi:MAG: TraM recognition domain-containing protein, partial [Bacillota bacterium]